MPEPLKLVVSPGCAPCHDLLHDLARTGPPDDRAHVVISTGDAAATAAVLDDIRLPCRETNKLGQLVC